MNAHLFVKYSKGERLDFAMNICERLLVVAVGFGLMCRLPAEAAYNEDLSCVRIVDESVRISREQLQRLQTIPSGTRASAEAYCVLPSGQMMTEDGDVVEVQRTLLPFEWDPENGLILLWQGDVYVGYDFRLVR